MADKPSAVHVEIFGLSYAVQAGAEPGYVEQLAGFVDQQMRDVSRGAGAVDSVRIAVLAALNIADELFQARSRVRGADEKLLSRADSLARELAAALED
jgi:cell division protein ZapA